VAITTCENSVQLLFSGTSTCLCSKYIVGMYKTRASADMIVYVMSAVGLDGA
jgi:hypothetical protein